MSEAYVFAIVLIALYLLECVSWVRGDALVFLHFPSLKWEVESKLADRPLGIPVLNNPLPPLDSAFVCKDASLEFSPEGLVTKTVGWHLTYAELTSVRAKGSWLVLNGDRVGKYPSYSRAKSVSRFLTELTVATREGRARMIRERLRAEVDLSAIKHRLESLRGKTEGLVIICNSLFLLLLVLIPGVMLGGAMNRLWPWLLAELVALMFLSALFFFDAHRELYPLQQEERLHHVLLISLWPIAAVRALDVLKRNLFQDFHPLATSFFLSSLTPKTRAALYDLRYGEPSGSTSEVTEVSRWFRTELSAALKEMLERAGLSEEQIFGPRRSLCNSGSFCPRCSAEFSGGQSTCSDCHVPLSSWTSALRGS